MEDIESPFDNDSNIKAEDVTSQTVDTSGVDSEEVELTPEEYKIKADELEARLNRIEGRYKKEERLSEIFKCQGLPVTVHPIEPKGKYM